MAEAIDGPREELSEYAPRIESIQIDPEKIGAVIGKGGETIRGLQEEFEAEIDIDDDGTVRVYAPTGKLVEGCIARIEAMTKEAEVGDRFKAQGREDDHLRRLRRADQGHRRPAAHLEREARRAGRDGRGRAQPGDELDVTVVEVDRERGRIGLRLSDDPAIEGKTPRSWPRSAPATRAAPRRDGEAAAAAIAADAAAAAAAARRGGRRGASAAS